MSSIIIDDICLYGLTTKITVILLAKAKGDAHCRGSLPACAALSCAVLPLRYRITDKSLPAVGQGGFYFAPRLCRAWRVAISAGVSRRQAPRWRTSMMAGRTPTAVTTTTTLGLQRPQGPQGRMLSACVLACWPGTACLTFPVTFPVTRTRTTRPAVVQCSKLPHQRPAGRATLAPPPLGAALRSMMASVPPNESPAPWPPVRALPLPRVHTGRAQTLPREWPMSRATPVAASPSEHANVLVVAVAPPHIRSG